MAWQVRDHEILLLLWPMVLLTWASFTLSVAEVAAISVSLALAIESVPQRY